MTGVMQELQKLWKETNIKIDVSQLRTCYATVNTMSLNEISLFLCFVIETPHKTIVKPS